MPNSCIAKGRKRKEVCTFYILSVAGSFIFSHVLSPPESRFFFLLLCSWEPHGGCSIIVEKRFFEMLSASGYVFLVCLFLSNPRFSLLPVAQTVVCCFCNLKLCLLPWKGRQNCLSLPNTLSIFIFFQGLLLDLFSSQVLLFLSTAQSYFPYCNTCRFL